AWILFTPPKWAAAGSPAEGDVSSPTTLEPEPAEKRPVEGGPGEAPALILLAPAGVAAEPAGETGPAQPPAVAETPVRPETRSPEPSPASAPAFSLEAASAALGWLYLGCAGVVLLRWAAGHLALGWLLRRSEPVPDHVARLHEELTAGRRRPRLVVSRRVRAPFSGGLFRPAGVRAALPRGRPR